MDGPDQLTKTRRCGSQRGQPLSLKVDDLKVPKFSTDRPNFNSFDIADRPLRIFPTVHFTQGLSTVYRLNHQVTDLIPIHRAFCP